MKRETALGTVALSIILLGNVIALSDTHLQDNHEQSDRQLETSLTFELLQGEVTTFRWKLGPPFFQFYVTSRDPYRIYYITGTEEAKFFRGSLISPILALRPLYLEKGTQVRVFGANAGKERLIPKITAYSILILSLPPSSETPLDQATWYLKTYFRAHEWPYMFNPHIIRMFISADLWFAGLLTEDSLLHQDYLFFLSNESRLIASKRYIGRNAVVRGNFSTEITGVRFVIKELYVKEGIGYIRIVF